METEEIEAQARSTPAFRGVLGFLSNFAPAPVFGFPTVEHAYVAAKTLDPDVREQIKAVRTPGQVKRFGRKIDLRPDWEDVKVDIMRTLVVEKFKDPDLAAKLLATGDVPLVEHNHWGDTFWGMCRGRGENVLGSILMEVRENLRKGD